MKFIRNILDKQKPHFQKGGKFERYYYLFEAGETFLYVPNLFIETFKTPRFWYQNNNLLSDLNIKLRSPYFWLNFVNSQ